MNIKAKGKIHFRVFHGKYHSFKPVEKMLIMSAREKSLTQYFFLATVVQGKRQHQRVLNILGVN